VVLIPAAFHGVVDRARALILDRLTAGKSADLADTFRRNKVEDGPVIADLTDGRQRQAVQIDFLDAACGAGE
jgi:hypothetical protein